MQAPSTKKALKLSMLERAGAAAGMQFHIKQFYTDELW